MHLELPLWERPFLFLVYSSVSLQIWSEVNGKNNNGKHYGAGSLGPNLGKGIKLSAWYFLDGDCSSLPPITTPKMIEIMKNLA